MHRKGKIGDVFSSELSWVHVVSMLTLASHDSDVDSFSIEPANCLTKLRDIKAYAKSMRKTMLSHYGVVALYPEDPNDLKLQHPEVYQAAYPNASPDDPSTLPVKSPLNAALLEQLRAKLPARVSHQSMAATKNKAQAQSTKHKRKA